MKINVVIHRDPDGLWAEVPALPHIVVNGRDQDDLLKQAREAIDLYFESASAQLPKQVGESVHVVEL